MKAVFRAHLLMLMDLIYVLKLSVGLPNILMSLFFEVFKVNCYSVIVI